MIVPTKHTNFSQSLLGFGSYILTKLESAKSIDSIWAEYQKDYNNDIYYYNHSFDNLILVLLFLYSIGAIKEHDGSIMRCD